MNTTTHEAAHVAGCVAACGMVPLEVRVDRPDLHIAGQCTANFRDHEPDFSYLVAILMGPMSGGHVIKWRPSMNGRARGDDERIAAALVEYLGLERHDFLNALATARDLLARDEVKAMIRLVAVALDGVPVLSELQLRELLAPYLPIFNVDKEGTPTP